MKPMQTANLKSSGATVRRTRAGTSRSIPLVLGCSGLSSLCLSTNLSLTIRSLLGPASWVFLIPLPVRRKRNLVRVQQVEVRSSLLPLGFQLLRDFHLLGRLLSVPQSRKEQTVLVVAHQRTLI